MIDNKAIQLIYAYRLTWAELTELSEVERAAFLAVLFCENEVNSLRRLSLLSMFWINENQRINEAAMIQRNMLLRTLTGKLFEFLSLYSHISSEGRSSISIVQAISNLKEENRACRKHAGFKIAEKIRNSQAHHYDLSEIIKLTNRNDKHERFELSFTPESGNSFFRFAENRIFNPDPKGRLAEEMQGEEAKRVVEDWIEWTLAATNLVRRLREELFEKLISLRNPKRHKDIKVEYLDEDLRVADIFRLPLFVRAQV